MAGGADLAGVARTRFRSLCVRVVYLPVVGARSRPERRPLLGTVFGGRYEAAPCPVAAAPSILGLQGGGLALPQPIGGRVAASLFWTEDRVFRRARRLHPLRF